LHYFHLYKHKRNMFRVQTTTISWMYTAHINQGKLSKVSNIFTIDNIYCALEKGLQDKRM